MEIPRESTPDEAYSSIYSQSDWNSNVDELKTIGTADQEHAKYLRRKKQKEEHDKLKMKLKNQNN